MVSVKMRNDHAAQIGRLNAQLRQLIHRRFFFSDKCRRGPTVKFIGKMARSFQKARGISSIKQVQAMCWVLNQ